MPTSAEEVNKNRCQSQGRQRRPVRVPLRSARLERGSANNRYPVLGGGCAGPVEPAAESLGVTTTEMVRKNQGYPAPPRSHETRSANAPPAPRVSIPL